MMNRGSCNFQLAHCNQSARLVWAVVCCGWCEPPSSWESSWFVVSCLGSNRSRRGQIQSEVKSSQLCYSSNRFSRDFFNRHFSYCFRAYFSFVSPYSARGARGVASDTGIPCIAIFSSVSHNAALVASTSKYNEYRCFFFKKLLNPPFPPLLFPPYPLS